MKIQLILMICVLAVGCASSSDRREIPEDEKASYLVRAADGALREGDPTGALNYLHQAEKLDPENAQLFHAKAIGLYTKRDVLGAIEAAKKAVSLNPEYSAARLTLGKLLMDLEKYPEAIPHLEKVASNPLFRGAHKARTNLGIIYYRQKKYSDARAQFDLAIRDQPRVACAAYYYRGNLHLQKKHYTTALKDYKKATRNYCGEFADAHYAIGLTYVRSRQFNRARNKFVEINRLFPDSSAAKKSAAQLRSLP